LTSKSLYREALALSRKAAMNTRLVYAFGVIAAALLVRRS
jgi:hypothetical protein